MATTYAKISYETIFKRSKDELGNPEGLLNLGIDLVKLWILDACREISEKTTIREERKLRIMQGQEEYEFADTTTPVTGTGNVDFSNLDITGKTTAGAGTITTDGTTVTGVGTSFLSLTVGMGLIVGDEVQTIVELHTNTEMVIADAFESDITTASSYTTTNTRFTRELVSGSIVTINSVTYTIDEVTNAYQATTTSPPSSAQTNKAFTVDTKVTELPTKYDGITGADYSLNGTITPIDVVSFDEYRDRKVGWNTGVSLFYNPLTMTITNNASGVRVLRLWDKPDIDREITVYATVKIDIEDYIDDADSDYIPISNTYEPAIRHFVKAKMYKRMGKEYEKDFVDEYGLFEKRINDIQQKVLRTVRVYKEIVYR